MEAKAFEGDPPDLGTLASWQRGDAVRSLPLCRHPALPAEGGVAMQVSADLPRPALPTPGQHKMARPGPRRTQCLRNRSAAAAARATMPAAPDSTKSSRSGSECPRCCRNPRTRSGARDWRWRAASAEKRTVFFADSPSDGRVLTQFGCQSPVSCANDISREFPFKLKGVRLIRKGQARLRSFEV